MTNFNENINTLGRSYIFWEEEQLNRDRRRIAIEEARSFGAILGGSPLSSLGELPDPYPSKERRFQIELLKPQVEKTVEFDPQIEKAIESSKYIMELPENWDEDGSPVYLKTTWERATRFVRRTALLFKKHTKQWIVAPKITPGPDGSIDVRWKNSKRSLLINFPADPNIPADFFGSDKQSDVIKGTLNLTSQNHWLLLWFNR